MIIEKNWDKTGFLEQISRFFRDKIGIYRHFLENFQIDFWGIFGPCIPGVLRISSDGDVRMGAKIKTPKNPWTNN